MSTVDTRAPFFPNSRTAKNQANKARAARALQRNSLDRMQEIESRTAKDAKVSIPETIKDFSRIKKAVDATEANTNQDKIAMLKAKIQAGTYEPDYDAIADKMLSSEF
ncbi:MAG: flagellar biosynthesis anti-sigma factor FlgM [Bacteriovoracaceae bacterium]|jgi:negative regulator of flagellin synthesis FlgM|nr:flagellar biosynthesis anti-sigma factor FlgM [Bacteriovoracaceae bacterium]